MDRTCSSRRVVGAKWEGREMVAGRSKLKRSQVQDFFRQTGYCLSLTSGRRFPVAATRALVNDMMRRWDEWRIC